MFAPEAPKDRGIFHAGVLEFPLEQDVYLLKENGEANALVNLNRLEPSQYWDSKSRWIGLIIVVCVGFLVISLLGETHFVDQAWQQFLGFAGQFMPKLPKLW